MIKDDLRDRIITYLNNYGHTCRFDDDKCCLYINIIHNKNYYLYVIPYVEIVNNSKEIELYLYNSIIYNFLLHS